MLAIIEQLKGFLSSRRPDVGRVPFAVLFETFQKILEQNNQVLELMASMGDKLGGNYVFDRQYIISSCQEAANLVSRLIYNLNIVAPKKYLDLYGVFEKIHATINQELAGKLVVPETDYAIPYQKISRELSDVVGGKNANLAEVKNLLGLPVPDGFAITTRAFQAYMEYNRLWDPIQSILAGSRLENRPSMEQAAAEIQQLILSGITPPALAKALREAVEALSNATSDPEPFVAIRSSARDEDSERTFAGQYQSFLNQPIKSLPECYKAVLASAYSASAMEYRRQNDFSESEVAMAVGCQLMAPAKVSGVLYSLDPQSPERDVMIISASWGLGAPIVAGTVSADQYIVSREPPYPITGLSVVRKGEQLASIPDGGTQIRPVAEDYQTRPCLSDEQIRRLVGMALSIERYFKKPQDIEWSMDDEDAFVILQARPLNVGNRVARLVDDIASVLKGYPILFSGKGMIAQRGIGSGKVFVVTTDQQLTDVPQGAILVTKHTSPRLAKVIKKVNGILTDIGSPTGHMATIAREFRVPTIVNTGAATHLLQTGQDITLDAEQNVVYAGTVKELRYIEYAGEVFEETYEYRLLRRVLKKIAPLNLLDPHDKNFTPFGCRTFHDITRFVHEKAVEELVNLKYDRHAGAAAIKLKFAIPLGLLLIDIGGGLNAPATAEEVKPAQVASVPMRALLEGMMEPGMWTTEPMSVDFGSFMSSLTRTFSSNMASPKYLGQNLAVVSKEYVNLNLRLGYHFNIIDAYISENPNDNYAYFRFLGGVTEFSRRSRRAKFLAEILAKYDFRVEVRGDLVVARIKKLEALGMIAKMRVLGRLVAFTRQLDVKMLSDEHMAKYIQDFMQLAEIRSTVGQP